MNEAIEVIQANMAAFVIAGFPVEAYGGAQAHAALLSANIDPWDLEFSPTELVRAVLTKICLERLDEMELAA
jgi:hypothetical protein